MVSPGLSLPFRGFTFNFNLGFLAGGGPSVAGEPSDPDVDIFLMDADDRCGIMSLAGTGDGLPPAISTRFGCLTRNYTLFEASLFSLFLHVRCQFRSERPTQMMTRWINSRALLLGMVPMGCDAVPGSRITTGGKRASPSPSRERVCE